MAKSISGSSAEGQTARSLGGCWPAFSIDRATALALLTDHGREMPCAVRTKLPHNTPARHGCEIDSENIFLGNWNEVFCENSKYYSCTSLNHKQIRVM